MLILNKSVTIRHFTLHARFQDQASMNHIQFTNRHNVRHVNLLQYNNQETYRRINPGLLISNKRCKELHTTLRNNYGGKCLLTKSSNMTMYT